MIHIVSDTSTLLSTKQGKEHNITITPLNVTIGNRSYHELDEIDTKGFLELLKNNDIPMSSQPSIGEKMEIYEELARDGDILDITMADGLSGTYASACNARQESTYAQRITVFNSKTLCGPHRYLVLKAVQLASQGKSIDDIVSELQYSVDREKSFLIPCDFSFLKRGGRLTPLAATIGGMLKVVPVMTLTEDHTRLEKFTMKRTFGKALQAIAECYKEMDVDENYYMTVTHANVLNQAVKVKEYLQTCFPSTEIELFDLSPVFITQGGPGCIAVQVIHK